MSRLLRSGALLLALAAASSLSAQTVELGAKGGWVRPTLAGKDVEGASARNTVGGGAFVAFPLSPAFAIQPEVLYLAKGTQATEGSATVKFHLGYIEVPVLARITFPIEGAKVKPYLIAGPAVAFRGKCEASATMATTSVSASCDDPELQTDIRKVDWSLTGGAGLALPLGKATGLLEARYDYSLQRLDTSSDDVKNRAFMVFAGVSVPLGNLKPAATRSR